MAYRIIRTAKADEQIREIIFYRESLTGSVDSALSLLDKLEQGIEKLTVFPDSGAPPRYAALRARGFRVLIIDKHLVFYKVDHESKTVTVYAVVDGRRDYLNLI